jgi:endonuclease YncB( thermonuclease family)
MRQRSNEASAPAGQRWPAFLRALAAGGSILALAAPIALGQEPAAPAARPASKPVAELYEIEKVVDGDTIHVRYHGGIEKLRLCSVDTEEKIGVSAGESGTKPSTVFGEECALWAQEFFADLAQPGETPRIGILFPEGREQRDAYGRLLCHVLLPDGTDFNLLLVRLGKSPYFNKYGNSVVCHDAFVAAQREAREKQLGIWNPQTNVPKTPGAPSARRPYETLLPWWEARAQAIDEFRKQAKADPDHVIDAEWPASLERGAQSGAKGEDVAVFGSIDKLFDEQGGDWTVLLRSEDKKRALRVRIPREARDKFATLGLPHFNDEFRQNYFWVRGRVSANARGFELRSEDPADWRIAEPAFQAAKPAPAGAGVK